MLSKEEEEEEKKDQIYNELFKTKHENYGSAYDTSLSSLFQIAQAFQNPADQNNTSTSPQTPCPYGLPRQNNGVCPIIPER